MAAYRAALVGAYLEGVAVVAAAPSVAVAASSVAAVPAQDAASFASKPPSVDHD